MCVCVCVCVSGCACVSVFDRTAADVNLGPNIGGFFVSISVPPNFLFSRSNLFMAFLLKVTDAQHPLNELAASLDSTDLSQWQKLMRWQNNKA